jgi:hypothetical protein
MSQLNPAKLHVRYLDEMQPGETTLPRCYTLTHSDTTGDLFLTIGRTYDREQISGWYTRLMRDEVLAEWKREEDSLGLHVHCHVSGGLVFGLARWRDAILRHHMPQVLQTFRHGDGELFVRFPEFERAPIWVHFHARQRSLDRVERWGTLADYRLEEKQ